MVRLVEEDVLCSPMDSLGKSATRGDLQRADPSLVRSDSNHMPYITLALTAHFIFRTNEFIIREDVPLGGSAQSRVTAQISHHYLCSRHLRSNSLRPDRAASWTELHKRAAFQAPRGRERVQVPNGRAVKSMGISLNDGWY